MIIPDHARKRIAVLIDMDIEALKRSTEYSEAEIIEAIEYYVMQRKKMGCKHEVISVEGRGNVCKKCGEKL